jgi:VWFA-related protein
MRFLAALFVTACAAFAQFKSTVPLVVAPTTITDSKGHFIDGLTAEDLVLYDNSVPQAIQADTVFNPISLVVVLQARSNSAAVLDKLGRSGILFSQLLAGEAGETAVVSFSNDVRVTQDFTTDPDLLSHAVQNVRVQGDGAAALDGVMQALRMLALRKPNRRQIILVIAEKRDRSSNVDIATVLQQVQHQNALVYWLTYSPFLTPFTNRQKTVGDRKKVEDRGKDPKKDAEVLPPDMAPGSLLSVFTEMAHLTKVDAAGLLSRASGGNTVNFLKQKALEDAVQAIADEVHRQYLISFQPGSDTPGLFHSIRVEVRDRPELHARTRAGYWTVQ